MDARLKPLAILTDAFPGTVSPVRVGDYFVRLKAVPNVVYVLWWTGACWRDPDGRPWGIPPDKFEWAGLAFDPDNIRESFSSNEPGLVGWFIPWHMEMIEPEEVK